MAAYAQRRPERQPRLHVSRPEVRRVHHARSTKAGASTPATPPVVSHEPGSSATLNEGWSVNPGYTRPAGRTRRRSSTLNEGRSVNPGYTPTSFTSASRSSSAQRRPERQPRLHHTGVADAAANTDAQRRPERQPRLHTSTTEPLGTNRAFGGTGRWHRWRERRPTHRGWVPSPRHDNG